MSKRTLDNCRLVKNMEDRGNRTENVQDIREAGRMMNHVRHAKSVS